MSLEDPEDLGPWPERAEASYRYLQAKWRYMVLGECATLLEASRRRMSVNEASQSPKDGYETAFEKEGERLECLREMMREYRSAMDVHLREMAGVK